MFRSSTASALSGVCQRGLMSLPARAAACQCRAARRKAAACAGRRRVHPPLPAHPLRLGVCFRITYRITYPTSGHFSLSDALLYRTNHAALCALLRPHRMHAGAVLPSCRGCRARRTLAGRVPARGDALVLPAERVRRRRQVLQDVLHGAARDWRPCGMRLQCQDDGQRRAQPRAPCFFLTGCVHTGFVAAHAL